MQCVYVIKWVEGETFFYRLSVLDQLSVLHIGRLTGNTGSGRFLTRFFLYVNCQTIFTCSSDITLSNFKCMSLMIYKIEDKLVSYTYSSTSVHRNILSCFHFTSKTWSWFYSITHQKWRMTSSLKIHSWSHLFVSVK